MLQARLSGESAVTEQIKSLALSKAKEKRLKKKSAAIVIKQSKGRLRSQTDLQGKPFANRQNPKNKKMLRRLGRGLKAKPDSTGITITWANALTAKIARRQQEGIDERFTAQQMAKIHGDNNNDPATRKQAKALLQAGYKIKRNKGNDWKSPTIKWVVANVKKGQAGVVLRKLRGKKSKSSWIAPGTARAFFGTNTQDLKILLKMMEKELNN
ncbi:MAG: virion morphogenesis protein [Algicola sp.]|nr:virion morphogenesis protein [Algicola sp.]